MQRYADAVLDKNGRAVVGAAVRVKTAAGATATVFGANGGAAISNPIQTDSLGRFAFYAADGRYSLEISIGGVLYTTVPDLILEDPADESEAHINGGTIKNAALETVTIDGEAPAVASDLTPIDTKANDAYSLADTANTAAGAAQADATQALTNAATADGKAVAAQATADAAVPSVTLAASGGSALVGFVQSGAGTEARTVEVKLREIEVNIMDFDGADPTGATFSDTAWISAMTYLRTAGDTIPKRLKLPRGKFRFAAAIPHYKGIAIEGEDTPAYHYYSSATLPEMSILSFANDTDGIYFDADFQRSAVRNVAIISEQHTAGTKVGLKLSQGSTAVAGSTKFEGLANQIENVLVYGWKIGVQIVGAYTWFQRFGSVVLHNCETGFDIEARSTHHTKIEHLYINRNEASTWAHADTTGIKLRCGGKLIIDNAIIENQANTFELAATTYTDLAATAKDRQLVVHDLYIESILQSVIKLTAPGYVTLDGVRATYAYYSSGTALVWAAFSGAPTEKSYISGRDIYFLGNASPDNRRFKQIYNGNATTGQMVDIDLDDVSIKDNDFESLWNANYPLNHIAFREKDDAGNQVTLVRNPSTVTRMLPIYNSGAGHVTTNALQFTSASGVSFTANQSNRLTQTKTRQPEEQKAIKTANEGRASTTTLATDTDLTLEILDAGTYEFEAILRFYTGSGAVGIQWRMQTSATLSGAPAFNANGYVNGGVYGSAGQASFGTITHSGITTGSSQPNYVVVKGFFTVTNTGNFRVEWAQNVSDVNSVYMTRGSMLSIKRID